MQPQHAEQALQDPRDRDVVLGRTVTLVSFSTHRRNQKQVDQPTDAQDTRG